MQTVDMGNSVPDNPLQTELRGLLNKYSAENGSDTPDFVLADYLLKCLETFDYYVRYRDSCKELQGTKLQPGVAYNVPGLEGTWKFMGLETADGGADGTATIHLNRE